MFGFLRGGSAKSAKTSTAKGSTTPKSSSGLSEDLIADLGLGDVGDAHVDVSDADMNDPALLGELNALVGGNLPKRPPPKKPVAPVAPKAAAVDLDAIHALASGGDEDVHVEVTDEDLNDHNLLGELHALTGEPPSPRRPAARALVSSPGEDEVDFSGGDAGAQVNNGDDQDDDIAALRASMSMQPETNMVSKPPAAATVIDEPAPTTAQPPRPSISGDDDVLPLAIKLKCSDASVLEKYIRIEKVKAAQFNRAGDKAGARESFMAYKQLEVRLNEVQSAPPPQAMPTRSPAPVPKRSASIASAASQPPPPPVSQASGQSTLPVLKSRLQQYKQTALAYKRQNNLPKARESLATAKAIEDLISQAELGESIDPSKIPPEPQPVAAESPAPSPAPASKPTSTAPSPAASKASKAAPTSGLTDAPMSIPKDTKQAYDMITEKLTAQIEACGAAAAQYYKSNDNNRALAFHKYKKSFAADLATLQSNEAAGAPVPRIRYTTVSYKLERNHLDLGLQDFEIGVVRAIGLSSKEVETSELEAYVVWDFGWPTEGPQVAQGKGNTPVASKGINPEFKYAKVVKIDRTKSFQRFLERRKATFEVYHNRGFLRKAVFLGKAIVKLDDFLQKCEVESFHELLDANGRRPTAGKLEIRMRMRQPILQTDISVISSPWLFIEDYNLGAYMELLGSPIESSPSQFSSRQSPALSPLSPEKSTAQVTRTANALSPPAVMHKSASQRSIDAVSVKSHETAERVSVSQPAAVAQSTPSRKATPEVQPEADASSDDMEALIEQFEDVERMVSNNVLEAEQKQVVQLIASSRGKPNDDLVDRKQQIDLKLQLLVLQVQMGKLSLEDYLAKVKMSMNETKKVALQFKRANRVDLAKRAMARLKIMQDEVEEAEAQGQE